MTPPPRFRSASDAVPSRVWLFVAALMVFLLFRPYEGIIHDASLYVGYAMAALDPHGIGRDIVFLNDGQSRYSLYPALLGALTASIGPSRAAVALTYGGLVLWFMAFGAFVRAMLRDRMQPAEIAAVVVLASSLPALYGGQGVFRVAEFYATPRVFAEAAVLAAFAAIVSKRAALSVVAFTVGLVFHPLMTAPGVGVALWYRAESPRARRALIGVAAVGVAVLVVGTLLYTGEAKPFARFDAEWMAALQAKHALVFIRNWHAGDAIRIVVQLVTVLLAVRALGERAQRLVRSSLVVGTAGLVVSALGADVLSNVVVTQVQAWRGLWVLATFAMMMLGVVLWSAWSPRHAATSTSSQKKLRQVASLFLVLAWFMVEINSTGLLFCGLAALLWMLPKRMPSFALPPHGPEAIGVLIVGILLLNVVAHSWVNVSIAWSSPDTTMRWSWRTLVSTGVPGMLVLVFGSAVLSGRVLLDGARISRMLPWSALALSALAMGSLDTRTRYQRFIERELDARAAGVPAADAVIRERTILWPYADLEPWALAGGPGWGAVTQGTPSVFDRALAIESRRRNAVMRAAGLLPVPPTGAETIGTLGAVVDSSTVRAACGREGSPDLLAVPEAVLKNVSATRVIQLSVPKVLYPLVVGDRWGRIDRYQLITCASADRSQ